MFDNNYYYIIISHSKSLSSRQNTVQELQNLHSPLQVQDLPQQILVEENSSRVLPEERNTNLDNVIGRRLNICTTQQKDTIKHNNNSKNQK